MRLTLDRDTPWRRARVILALAVIPLSGAVACARSAVMAPSPTPSAGAMVGSTREFPARELRPSDLTPGARIRYRIRDHWRGVRTGEVARATVDTVWLVDGRTLPVARLRRLDLSRGGATVERRMAWGAGIGAGVGALVGVIVAPGSPRSETAPPRGLGTFMLASTGMVYGALAGLLVPGEQWDPITITSAAR